MVRRNGQTQLTFPMKGDTLAHPRRFEGRMLPTPGPSVTELLVRWSGGDISARDALVPLVYDELRRIARRCLTSRAADHPLQPTALVHEAYLRLANRDALRVRDRAHFYAMAAQMMRQILVDYARKEQAAKRGGLAITLSLDEAVHHAPAEETDLDLLALDDAMKRLALLDARQCQIVELRFFGGLSIEETAVAADISQATAKREWATARVWLHHAITKGRVIP
jgi:RNA polymerase sigma factor (TIGR02999 family)